MEERNFVVGRREWRRKARNINNQLLFSASVQSGAVASLYLRIEEVVCPARLELPLGYKANESPSVERGDAFGTLVIGS